MFWRGARATGATTAQVLGSAGGLILFLCNVVSGWTHFHFLYAALILTLLATAILVAVSIHKAHTASASQLATMWKMDYRRAEHERLRLVPCGQDYRFQGLALLILTAALVVAFR